jgi:L-amino acid N-acyltransferase YncA
MSAEWNLGLGNSIRPAILDELGEEIVISELDTRFNLKYFNQPPLQASRSGILEVVDKAKCLEIVRTRTEHGTVYEAVLSKGVRERLSQMPLPGAIKSVCGTRKNPEKVCHHLIAEGRCGIRQTLDEIELDNQLLIENDGVFHPSETLFARYLEGNMAIPQQVWGILAYTGNEILKHMDEFSFSDLCSSTFSNDQLQRVGRMMSFAHQKSNINSTVADYDSKSGFPAEGIIVESHILDELWQNIIQTFTAHCQLIFANRGLIQKDISQIYIGKSIADLNELDSLDMENIKADFVSLQRLYSYSQEFLCNFEGKKLAKTYRNGFMRESGKYANSFFDLSQNGKTDAHEAFREYVDVCFNYGLEVLKIPEKLLRDLFLVNRVEPRIFDSEREVKPRLEVVSMPHQVGQLEEFYAGEYAAYLRGDNNGILSYYVGNVAPTGEFIDRLEMKTHVVSLKDRDGNIMGWGNMMRTAGKENYYVLDYYIGHKARRRGAGYILLDSMVTHLRDEIGGNGIIVDIKVDNQASLKTVLKLISKNGFEYDFTKGTSMYRFTIQLR